MIWSFDKRNVSKKGKCKLSRRKEKREKLREKLVALVAGRNVLAQKVLFSMALWKRWGCACLFISGSHIQLWYPLILAHLQYVLFT